MSGSIIFIKLLKQELGVEAQAEYRFHPTRRWRFDYCIPKYKIAIEVEGGIWISGRHNRASGFVKDIEKYNNATMLGYRLLKVTPQELLTVGFLEQIKTTINTLKKEYTQAWENQENPQNKRD